jgi:putative ABC transport system ATP-binding protein
MNALLHIRSLIKGYTLGERRIDVLRGLCMSVDSAEMVAIMGPSGSGKTTLLNCISGIDSPEAGEVELSGKPVNYASEREKTFLRRRHIGMVFQFFNLIPTLTVWENVALPLMISKAPEHAYRKRVNDLLIQVGLEARAEHHPFQLSGGEMQLVSIARALVHSPALLLADEPTGNVNPTVGRAIMDILRRTAKLQRTAIVLVTHSAEHAAWADRVCFLKEGVIAQVHIQGGKQDAVSPIYDHLLRLEI